MYSGVWTKGPYITETIHPGTVFCMFEVRISQEEKLIPQLFPDGNLSDVGLTAKILFGRRIRALYISGTVVPMIILVGTLFFAI